MLWLCFSGVLIMSFALKMQLLHLWWLAIWHRAAPYSTLESVFAFTPPVLMDVCLQSGMHLHTLAPFPPTRRHTQKNTPFSFSLSVSTDWMFYLPSSLSVSPPFLHVALCSFSTSFLVPSSQVKACLLERQYFLSSLWCFLVPEDATTQDWCCERLLSASSAAPQNSRTEEY